MSITATLLDCKAINEALRAGAVEQESLDAQLSESLAALEAYQSHLDAWQQNLSREREELRSAREQFDRYRTAAEKSTELLAELEKIRAHESELQAAVDEHQRTLECERAHWNAEIRELREKLEHRAEPSQSASQSDAAGEAGPVAEPPRAPSKNHREPSNSSAVLGSIVEQFGKLRAQRAVDRQGLKKAR